MGEGGAKRTLKGGDAPLRVRAGAELRDYLHHFVVLSERGQFFRGCHFVVTHGYSPQPLRGTEFATADGHVIDMNVADRRGTEVARAG